VSKVSGSSAVSGVVVTIGELVVDWISLEKGRDWSESQTFLRSPGGNAANVAQALAKLGSRSRLVAKIGRDIHAGYLLDALKQTGVDIDHVYITCSPMPVRRILFSIGLNQMPVTSSP
jgi:fructokinase